MSTFSSRCVLAIFTMAAFTAFQIFFLRNRATSIVVPGIVEQNNLQKKLPSALIIGVRKGGTRALLDGIALHPLVRIVRHETHFFDINYGKGIDWYAEQMPSVGENEVVIEKTPAYFTNLKTPARVFQMNPGMKIVLIVRHPTYRAISDYTQVFYNKLELNKALPNLEKEAFTFWNGTQVLDDTYKPIRNSLYDIHISNWLKFFPLENFLILNGDVFRGNPYSELQKLESFLGLEHQIDHSQLVFDKRKKFFCFKKTTRIRCLGESKGRKHRPVSQQVFQNISQLLAPHNERFFSLINRTFLWD